MTDKLLNILLVDDDDVSCESIIRGFKKQEILFPVMTAGDGQEALDILRNKHESKKLEGQYIILLDLNMPRMNGFEFLKEIRSDASLSSSIIFVLTTSSSDSDRIRAYEDNIAGYMIKSAVGPQFKKLASLLTDYNTSVKLP